MNRRDVFRLSGMAVVAAAIERSQIFAQAPVERPKRALTIRKIEAFIVRTPNDGKPETMSMPKIDELREGVGLWNRFDFSLPSRSPGLAQTVFVKITAENGLVGWGESHAPASPQVQRDTVLGTFSPLLIGEDARDIEVLWERMYSSQRMRGYGTGSFTEAIAGVDIALWDLLGKSLDMPVYRLLGGRFRDKVQTLLWLRGKTPDEVRKEAQSVLDQGYTVLKYGFHNGPNTWNTDCIRAISEVIGKKGQLIVDSLGSWKAFEAIELGKELDALGNIGWWEDPLLVEDDLGYERLAASIRTPLCKGEVLSNRYQARDLYMRKAIAITNLDLARAGGITECKRMAMLADVFGIMWSPHVSMGSIPYMAASIHLAAATPNVLFMEHQGGDTGPFGNRLIKEPLEYHGGYVNIPERPGLGFEFDEGELRKVIVA
jgi:L-alanine-DL-glutamate epimerase-like enolase superfamily enzyme